MPTTERNGVSQQRENHAGARMQTSFNPSEIWGGWTPAALLVAAANATQTSGGSEWQNWVSGGVISSAIVTNVTLTSFLICDQGIVATTEPRAGMLTHP